MKKLFVVLAAMLTFTSTVFAQIGSAASDLVYTPVTPCRIIDTRPEFGGTGSIPAGTTSGFYAANSAGFAYQGGSATNCGITAGLATAAVAINFTVVTPAAAGFITVFPWGGTRPTASTLNYTAGAVVGNSAIVKVSQATYTAMNIFSSATTHVVADIVGYYSKPVSAGSFECVLQPTQAVSLPAGYDTYTFTTSTCSTGYTAVSPYCYKGSATSVYSTGSGIAGGAWCAWANLSGAPQTVHQSTNCCRIPGR